MIGSGFQIYTSRVPNNYVNQTTKIYILFHFINIQLVNFMTLTPINKCMVYDRRSETKFHAGSYILAKS